MKIGIIDADLIGRKKHRFPNLCCMKLSAYHKEQGDEVRLVMSYGGLEAFDKVYIAKVFTDTPVPKEVLQMKNVAYGGTGFFYDKAVPLPEDVEHHMPDYHLYDEWVAGQITNGENAAGYSYYLEWSIGYLTRGCFRKCKFCVNQNYDRVSEHSPLKEFLDKKRKKICMLDDNFFGYIHWENLLKDVVATKKMYQFKQGMDIRLLDDKKAEMLFSSKYYGHLTFAFDNVADAELIEEKIKLARKYTAEPLKFYCFCGFDREGRWDREFWVKDILDLMKRIQLLLKYRCIPYVMRFNRYKESPYRGVYVTVARWCNQVNMVKKTSLREYVRIDGNQERMSSGFRYVNAFLKEHPEMKQYMDIKY